jgi:hypothetical protein
MQAPGGCQGKTNGFILDAFPPDMLFVVTTMKTAAVPSLLLALVLVAAARGEEEGVTENFNLPASVYPAVYFYGGMATGPTYTGAAALTDGVRGAGGSGVLPDVGRLAAFGFTFDYFVAPSLAAEIKIVHEVAPERDAFFAAYDYRVFPGKPFITRDQSGPYVVSDAVSYRYQNIDYKVGLKYVPFPSWFATPYVVATAGGNSTLIATVDLNTDPTIQKWTGGALVPDDTTSQQYSFDWAGVAGVHLNLSSHLFLVGEAMFDRPFTKHYLADYTYDTAVTAFYAGAGWQFR